MDEKLLRARQLCLDQALGFIEATDHLRDKGAAHIIYHLGLLALEEIGKASMLTAQMVNYPGLDGSWIERSLDSHRRKLQWAVWSPMSRIDPADFVAARQFAERAHAMRLASLYVDSKADRTDLPPSEQVNSADAEQIMSLARARLEYERNRTIQDGEFDELTVWFLDSMSDTDRSRLLLSKAFVAQYEVLDGDARAWACWARDEVARRDLENRQILEAELARPGVNKEEAKLRWRANAVVFTPSHSLRPKSLAHWNSQIEAVKLVWTGKKDQFTLQLTLHDNEPLHQLAARLSFLAKLVVACLNIGSIGYFWFERSGFEQRMFQDIRDLKVDRQIEIGSNEGLWGEEKHRPALTDQHIDHALRCMMAFAPLHEAEAEKIFRPYLDGLALVAKSDVFYDFNELARAAFQASLYGALHHYGGWSGQPDEFAECFHNAFSSFMPDEDHRNKMLKVLAPKGNPAESPLANCRSAKQLADLYLISIGRQNWRAIEGVSA